MVLIVVARVGLISIVCIFFFFILVAVVKGSFVVVEPWQIAPS